MAETSWVSVCPRNFLPVGLQIPVVAQSRVFVQPWEGVAGVDEIVQVAQACERAGFWYIGVCDHIAIPRSHVPQMSATWYDVVATLGFLAAVTERIRLLSYVFIPAYRHPLAVAKAFCTLDALSKGRLIVGLGAGHLEAEFQALGVNFSRRGALLEESVMALKACFADEFPCHTGTRWQFADFAIAPRPVQRPRPPIWIGGSTLPALRRTARLADGWLPQGPPPQGMEEGIRFLRAERRKLHGDAPLDISIHAPWMYLGRSRSDLPAGTVAGSPQQMAEVLLGFHKLGATHVMVRFRSRSCAELVEQIARFGEEVVPALRLG